MSIAAPERNLFVVMKLWGRVLAYLGYAILFFGSTSTLMSLFNLFTKGPSGSTSLLFGFAVIGAGAMLVALAETLVVLFTIERNIRVIAEVQYAEHHRRMSEAAPRQ